MIDIVVPSDNEKEFVKIAIRLGYKAICFLYREDQYNTVKLPQSKDIKVFKGLLLEKAKMKDYSTVPFVIVKDNTIKQMKRYADGILDIEHGKDYLHHRGSGLDHVICREMVKAEIAYCIPFSVLSNPVKSGKVMQNVALCSKYKVPMILASFSKEPYEMRGISDIESVGILLGMHSSVVKQSMKYAYKVLKDHTDPKKLKKGIYKI